MPQPKTHVIIYSHGFGVRKDDRGLFTDIAEQFPNARRIMFDYNPVNEKSNTVTSKPLDDQALKLRKMINNARLDYPNSIIDLVCHSQGCVIAGLVKPRDIRKIIMITPPDEISEASMTAWLNKAMDIEIDTSVRTRLSRGDGSTTVVHPEYWQSLAGVHPVKLYNLLARVTALRMISAKQDDVLGETAFEGIDPSISHVRLEGNHSFDDPESRKRLLWILGKELSVEQ